MATPADAPDARAGWYPHPTDPGLIRYWDGRSWTVNTLPKPAGSGVGKRVAWWQTWWAVVPGLLLCMPFGLVGLWRRPGLSTWLRVGVTLATIALVGGVVLADDGTTPTTDDSASAATAVPSSAASTPTTTPEPAPSVTEPPRSVMPTVVGLTRQQAEQALAAAGLGVREVRQVPSPQPRGTVLRQGRQVGASLLAGSTVVLVVAAPYPRVPSVVGRSESAAVSRLQGAGFEVTVTTEPRSSGRDGIVLRQTPAGSDRAKPGSTITVVVSFVVRTVAPPPAQNCTPGYKPCLPPASDYDCAGGSGDGPEYAYGPIYITGSDPYDLDADGDGVACEG